MCPAFFFALTSLKLPTMQAKLGKLENIIGHTFKDLRLLERAITHRSWAHENIHGETGEAIRERDNESLEFIGDSVLGLIVAEQLFRRNPHASEGELTLMKHYLVSGSALAELSDKLNLGEFLRLGGSEVKTGRKKLSLLTNTLEAVIGAVFIDAGYVKTRVVVTRLMEEKLKTVTPEASVDFKSRLQTQLQAEKQTTAKYALIRSEGPPHARTFYVEVIWESGNAHGQGNSIKSAEMMAASEALKILDKPKKPGAKRAAKK
jgi:ribonuclease-3